MDEPRQQTVSPTQNPSETASLSFVGRWNRLITTTNWEKGRIICQWRAALQSEDASPSDYSDDQWARQVEHLSGQHVGRLRRVYQRFGQSFESYEGLYWSHFQAALDWDDSEMWLEGALQNGWSVAAMRDQRWETLGRPEQSRPLSEDIVSSEIDEDAEPVETDRVAENGLVADTDTTAHEVQPAGEGEESNDNAQADGNFSDDSSGGYQDAIAASAPAADAAQLPQPFADLNELPGDLGDAFEAMKLAILHHRLEDWKQASCRDTVAALDALRTLASAPTDVSD